MSPAASLADPRIQAFLDAKEVVVLAMTRADGAPAATPMWHLPAADALYMISVDDTWKVHNLRRDPRVAVVAETTAPGGAIHGVVLSGRAEFLPESPERRALAERFRDRYHPRLERLWAGRAMPDNRVMFRIAVAHLRSWGLDS
jgi:PPOX class probable F420-dependent enzyme